MWRPIGIPCEDDGRHAYNRACGKALFQIVIFRLAFRQALPPAVIMDHDADVIRIVEGRCAAVKRLIIEVPHRRSQLPDELRKIVPVFVITCAAAFCRKIKLVPPFEFRVWWQRRLAGFLTADQITADRKRSPCSVPVKTTDYDWQPGQLSTLLTPLSFSDGPNLIVNIR